MTIWEHHSLASLEETLKAHEDGGYVSGFDDHGDGPRLGRIGKPGCGEIHDYWDDGEPCTIEQQSGRKCRIRYIPDPNGPDEIVD
jgi:hypothetical protein